MALAALCHEVRRDWAAPTEMVRVMLAAAEAVLAGQDDTPDVDWTPFEGAGPCIACGASDVTLTQTVTGRFLRECRICGFVWRATPAVEPARMVDYVPLCDWLIQLSFAIEEWEKLGYTDVVRTIKILRDRLDRIVDGRPAEPEVGTP